MKIPHREKKLCRNLKKSKLKIEAKSEIRKFNLLKNM